MRTCRNYWTVATVFEMHVLFERPDLAIVAAYHMARLHAPVWCICSTLGNVRLIQEQREREDLLHSVRPAPLEPLLLLPLLAPARRACAS